MYWPPLITKSTNKSEKGLIAVNTNDIGFLLNQSTPVMYAIKSAWRTGNILVSAILIISNTVAHEVNKDIIKRNGRDSKGQVLSQCKLRQLAYCRLESKYAKHTGASINHRPV